MIGEILGALLDGILINLPGPSLFKLKSSRLSLLSRFLAGSISLVVWIAACGLLADYLEWFDSPEKSFLRLVIFMIGVSFGGVAIYWLALWIAELMEGKQAAGARQQSRRLSPTGEMVVSIATGGSFLIVCIGGVYILRLFPGWLDTPRVNFSLLAVSSGIAILCGALAILRFEAKLCKTGNPDSGAMTNKGNGPKIEK